MAFARTRTKVQFSTTQQHLSMIKNTPDIQTLSDRIKQELQNTYEPREIQAITLIILEEVLQLPQSQILADRSHTVSTAEWGKTQNIIQRLKQNEPLQYVLGKTFFYGMELKVEKGVLIPRQETEELVKWTIDTVKNTANRSNFQMIDIGSGSGNIALSLAKAFPDAQVTALDISEKALEVTQHNAELNELNIELKKADILHFERKFLKSSPGRYDLIISNPPYVRESEKAQMHANVLQHEPNEALFVPDDNALQFYEAIARFAVFYLKPNGWIFFEINEALSEPLIKLLNSKHFKLVEVQNDINGKPRMLRCKLL